jgi:hypothetical protein
MFVRPTSHIRALPLIRAHRGLEEVRSGESRCIAQSCRIDKVGACLEIPGGTAHRTVFADGPVSTRDRVLLATAN